SLSVTFKTVGTYTLTASDATDGTKTSSTSSSITVNAGAVAKLQILLGGETAAPGSVTGKTGSPTNQTAGVTITNAIRVNAVDADWNLGTTATTNVTITSSDANAVISNDNGTNAGNITLVAGTAVLSNFTFKAAGAQTITATDAGAVLTGNTSSVVAVNA